MRADLIIDMEGKPGQTYRVFDDFYRDLAYKLVDFAYGPARPTRDHPPDAPPRRAANPLPEPNLTAAERHEIAPQGGMMGGVGDAVWTLNGTSTTRDGQANMPPLFTPRREQSCVLVLGNETAWWHPMHLDGHSVRRRQPKVRPIWFYDGPPEQGLGVAAGSRCKKTVNTEPVPGVLSISRNPR
jgi:FtsP/CotA-like multicopper oxidase with cupredoxin domain